MPRLSLYKPEKGSDFKFIDRIIGEQFQVGGTDIYVHKYLGPVSPDEVGGEATPVQPNTGGNAIPELGIQDVLLMENRDRKYDPDVYVIRGIYTMQDLDFNLTQFGIMLNNDNIMMHFHIKNSVDALSRKIMAGDVLELPHLQDDYGLDQNNITALKRFYVVQEVTRPAAGFSPTWYPHLLKAKCAPLVDSQEFAEILNVDSGNGDGSTLRDLLSTYSKSIEINNQVIAQAELDAPKSGYDTSGYYVLPLKDDGLLNVADVSDDGMDASIENATFDASIVLQSPSRDLYVGYLTGDGIPANGAPFGQGIVFPSNPLNGQFYLRTDYLPNRLFRYDSNHWKMFEQNVRMTMDNTGANDYAAITMGAQVRKTQKTGFINNNTTSTVGGKIINERQALSKALKPRADN
jgi:hypothetical protein